MALNAQQGGVDLAQMFAGATGVNIVRIPFLEDAVIPGDKMDRLREELSQLIKTEIAADALLIPSADGFLAVSNTARLDSHASELFFKLVQQRLNGAGLSGIVDHAKLSLDNVVSKPSRSVEERATYDAFIALEFAERSKLLSEIQAGYDEAAVSFNQIMRLRNSETMGVYARFDGVPKAPNGFGHQLRDDYYEAAPLCAAIDLFLLRQAAKKVRQMLEIGRRWPVYVPVNLANLLDQAVFKCYDLELRNILPGVRGFIAFDLVRVHPGTPVSRLSQAVSKIKPYTNYISASLPHDWRRQDDINFCGISEVGISLGGEKKAFEEEMAQVRRFANSFQSNTMAISVRNVPRGRVQDLGKIAAVDQAVLEGASKKEKKFSDEGVVFV